MSEAEATCDRIAIINKGRVVADDTTSNLKQNLEKNTLIRLSIKGAQKEEALNLLDSIDEDLDVKAIEDSEQNTVSFELTCSTEKDFRSDIYLKINVPYKTS